MASDLLPLILTGFDDDKFTAELDGWLLLSLKEDPFFFLFFLDFPCSQLDSGRTAEHSDFETSEDDLAEGLLSILLWSGCQIHSFVEVDGETFEEEVVVTVTNPILTDEVLTGTLAWTVFSAFLFFFCCFLLLATFLLSLFLLLLLLLTVLLALLDWLLFLSLSFLSSLFVQELSVLLLFALSSASSSHESMTCSSELLFSFLTGEEMVDNLIDCCSTDVWAVALFFISPSLDLDA